LVVNGTQIFCTICPPCSSKVRWNPPRASQEYAWSRLSATMRRYFVLFTVQSPKACMGWLAVAPVRTIHFAALRWVRSSEAMSGNVVGMRALSTNGCSA
jgi:hypothetical protein